MRRADDGRKVLRRLANGLRDISLASSFRVTKGISLEEKVRFL